MENIIRILIVEDSPDDAELTKRELKKIGTPYEIQWVDSKASFLKELETRLPDVILCDYKMPDLGGREALEIVRGRSQVIPFIVVSGTIGEDIAVEMLRAGATDYILKDKRQRLGFAVERALEAGRELTKRKEAQEALKFNEQRLQLLFEFAPDAIYISDLNGKFIDGNIAAQELIGYKKEELIGKTYFEAGLLPTDQVPKVMALLAKNINGEPAGPDELDLKTRDNRVVTIEISTYPVKIAEQMVIMGIARDITERKKSQSEILFINAILKAESEVTLDGILIVDESGKILMSNGRFALMWNIPQEIMDSRDDLRIIHFILDQLKEPDDFVKKMEYLYAHKDKTIRDEIQLNDGKVFDRYCSPLKDPSGKYYGKIWYFRDVTDRKKVEESQRLAQLGQLISDMAHEVNNPLMIISGNAQLCLMEPLKNKAVEENLRVVVDQCDRAKAIIQRLLTFSKPSKGEVREVNINVVVDSSAKLLEHQYSLSNIKIIKNYYAQLPLVSVDEKQMQEVFINIIRNAAEAMPQGGIITIVTGKDGERLRIDFTDTGTGMSDESMKNLFVPFYSTKEKGTGLGLAVCYGIIKSHGGELRYASEVGKGTTATILLPWGGE